MPLNEDVTLGKDKQFVTSDVKGASGTLNIPNTASWTPTDTTQFAVEAIISCDGAASDPANLTDLACIKCESAGNATGMADVDDDAAILSIQGFTGATGVAHCISTTRLAELPASTIGLRIRFGTTVYYIPAVLSTEWN